MCKTCNMSETAKKDVRVQLVISQPEIEALDEWRARNKVWSRSAAIRQLVSEGVRKRT